ncbi:hypothetical protein NL676_033194 [Syzygium grande]|nr:hypothetical protein NL676_033194 [Syzygium grande]
MPIFCDINSSDLKDQRGCVGKSFHKHENGGVDCKDIAKWKQALREIAEREGCELPNTNNGHQDEHINTAVSYILQLWNHNDVLSTLNGEESAKDVEALCLTFDEGQSECFGWERFGHLRHLRFLRLDQATIGGSSPKVLSNLSLVTGDSQRMGANPGGKVCSCFYIWDY